MRPRPAEANELGSLAQLVRGHPLFTRYGIEPASLERALGEVLAAGEAAAGEAAAGEAAAGEAAAGDIVRVAEADGHPRGFAWWSPRGAFARSPYLRLLVVAHDAVGRGVGSALMDAFEAAAFADADDAFLLVTHDNEAAQRFYLRRGYAEVGRLPDYVRPGITEVVLRKRRSA